MAVLVVEDDEFYRNRLVEALTDGGSETIAARSAEEALRIEQDSFDAAIVDVMLPNDPASSGISVEETRGGYLTGVALARRIRKSKPNIKLALLTGDVWNGEVDNWAAENCVSLLRKDHSRRLILDDLRRVGFLSGSAKPKAFIVHGHDESALLQLKNYLQNVLRWDEPIILREQPNCGRVLIEKFEDCSERIDCVFVLLTPDDPSSSGGTTRGARAKMSSLRPDSLLGGSVAAQAESSCYTRLTELPSDILGVAWISIDHGVEAAGEEIRREIWR